MVCSPDIREVVLEHARVTALDEHPENDVKPVARGAWRPALIYARGETGDSRTQTRVWPRDNSPQIGAPEKFKPALN